MVEREQEEADQEIVIEEDVQEVEKEEDDLEVVIGRGDQGVEIGKEDQEVEIERNGHEVHLKEKLFKKPRYALDLEMSQARLNLHEVNKSRSVV